MKSPTIHHRARLPVAAACFVFLLSASPLHPQQSQPAPTSETLVHLASSQTIADALEFDATQISTRIDTAVENAVSPLKPRFTSALYEAVDVLIPDRAGRKKKVKRRYANPWGVVMPSIFSFLEESEEGSKPVYLIDIVEGAIDAHMRTLGEIAWEHESRGDFTYGEKLGHKNPDRGGSGVIAVQPLAGLSNIRIHFRASVQYGTGRKPAVVVFFHYRPDEDLEPLRCRLIIPSAGKSPVFSRQLEMERDGETVLEERAYGYVPRLVSARAILQVNLDDQWLRPPNDWQEFYRLKERTWDLRALQRPDPTWPLSATRP